MRVYSINPASFAVWLLTAIKVFGGALLLWSLGAPAWAVAAWLMWPVHFKVRKRT